MQSNNQGQRYAFLFCILLIVAAILFLTGANGTSAVGRYRMQIVVRNNFSEIYVIDTTTGVVKWVGDQEGKPFGELKDK